MTHSVAINLYDATDEERMDKRTRQLMFAGKLQFDMPIRVDGTKEGVAIPFVCDDVMAAMIIDVLRSNDRRADRPETRAYILRGGIWRRIPANVVLVNNVDGKPRLNAEFFPPQYVIVEKVSSKYTDSF